MNSNTPNPVSPQTNNTQPLQQANNQEATSSQQSIVNPLGQQQTDAIQSVQPEAGVAPAQNPVSPTSQSTPAGLPPLPSIPSNSAVKEPDSLNAGPSEDAQTTNEVVPVESGNKESSPLATMLTGLSVLSIVLLAVYVVAIAVPPINDIACDSAGDDGILVEIFGC